MDVRDSFADEDMDDTETVALIGGGHGYGRGHGYGKMHGACPWERVLLQPISS